MGLDETAPPTSEAPITDAQKIRMVLSHAEVAISEVRPPESESTGNGTERVVSSLPIKTALVAEVSPLADSEEKREEAKSVDVDADVPVKVRVDPPINIEEEEEEEEAETLHIRLELPAKDKVRALANFAEEEEEEDAESVSVHLDNSDESWNTQGQGVSGTMEETGLEETVVTVATEEKSDVDEVMGVGEFEEGFPSSEFEICLERDFFHRVTNLREYAKMNAAWKEFLADPRCIYKHIVMKMTLAHRLFGIIPAVKDDSVFVETENGSFRACMMYGMASSLVIFYLVVFACIDMSSKSPTAAAVIVWVIDTIIAKVFRFRAQKVLEDSRMGRNRSLVR
jgi:hypothetical protein